MRVAGIYAKASNPASHFLDLMLGALEPATHRQLRTLVFPSKNPLIAAAINEEGNPPAKWALRPDGSFAILDREIYNTAMRLVIQDVGWESLLVFRDRWGMMPRFYLE